MTAEQIRLCAISSAVTHATIANTERYVRLDNVSLRHSGLISPTIISHGPRSAAYLFIPGSLSFFGGGRGGVLCLSC